MDPLTDILSGLSIRRAMFTRLEASAPWGFDSSGEPFLKFVLLMRGSAILKTAGSPEPIALRSGDVFIMLRDQPYQIYDHENSATTDCVDIEKLRIGNKIEVGGGGALRHHTGRSAPSSPRASVTGQRPCRLHAGRRAS